MRKISLQFIALWLIYLAFRPASGGQNAAVVALRDGGTLALVGMTLFAFMALDLWRPERAPLLYKWTTLGRILFLAGALAALSGGALFLLPAGGSMLSALRITLWLAGMIMLAVGAFRERAAHRYHAPSYRWTVDEEGAQVRIPVKDAPATPSLPLNLPRGYVLGLTLLVMFLGAFVRLWQLTSLPANCFQAECALGLRLLEPGARVIADNPFSLYGWIARRLYEFTGNGLLSLRLAGALVSLATLPLFFAAARRVSGPGGALTATLLLALDPWHVAAARSGESRLVFTLLFTLALWSILQAVNDRRRGWLVLGGLATGALCLAVPAWRLPVWGWATIMALLSLRNGDKEPGRRALNPFLYGTAVIAASLPVLSLPDPAAPPIGELAQNLAALGTAFSQSAGVGILALAGVGVLLRRLRSRRAAILLTSLAFAGGVLALRLASADVGGILSILTPLVFLCAAIALDQVMRTVGNAWQSVIRPQTLLAAALILALAPAGWRLFKAEDLLYGQSAQQEQPTYIAMADYLAQTMTAADATDSAPIFFVPPELLDMPAAQLMLDPAAIGVRIRPLDDVMALLSGENSLHDQQLLIAPDDEPTRESMAWILPEITARALPEDEPQFLLFDLPAADIAARQGVAGAYTRNGALLTDQRDGPLAFDWTAPPNLRGPFEATWHGSLLIPAAGAYSFGVDGAASPDTILTLLLDDRLILDTSLELYAQRAELPQGAHRLTMTYQTAAANPPPLTVTWTPPGGTPEPIPRTALLSPALPDVGLLATYFTDANFNGTPLTTRKEMIVGAPTRDPVVVAVAWQGKLAATRAGEYLLAAVADGDYQLIVDGRSLFDNRIAQPGEELSAYTAARIYLESGWHEIAVRYMPSSPDVALTLLWQPPGSEPRLLSSRYLLPYTAPLETIDQPLPEPPPLVGAELGDDRFALTRLFTGEEVQAGRPADDLPNLPLIRLWQTGACGSGENAFARPHGVVISPAHQRIYVADTDNRRVVAYTLSGSMDAVYADEQLEEISDLALGPAGALLVLDAGSQQVYRLDPATGAFTQMALSTGFYRPRGFDADETGALLVADTGGGRVVRLDETGALSNAFGDPASVLGIGQPTDTLATASALWAVTSEDGRLWNLTANGSIGAVQRALSMDGPHFAALADGGFLLSDPAAGRIVRFTTQGRPIAQIDPQGAFLTPTGIAVLEQGGDLLLAVADTQACTLSLWRGPGLQ
ncbi:MAG: glycosyltransferase family 39 protein [Caldilineaceae bacterium]|nr:glycosyltransferase family 39 protein [Caldilineaceae bacterium]